MKAFKGENELDGPEPEEERVVSRVNSRKDKPQDAKNAKNRQKHNN